MKGYLFKQGNDVTQKWRKRYFILDKNDLKYYENDSVIFI